MIQLIQKNLFYTNICVLFFFKTLLRAPFSSLPHALMPTWRPYNHNARNWAKSSAKTKSRTPTLSTRQGFIPSFSTCNGLSLSQLLHFMQTSIIDRPTLKQQEYFLTNSVISEMIMYMPIAFLHQRM